MGREVLDKLDEKVFKESCEKTRSMERFIELEEGLEFIKNGIEKLIDLHERFPEKKVISGDEYMKLYTYIYNMCIQKPPYDYSEELYNLYRQSIEGYLREGTLLSSLREKQDELLLLELLNRWKIYKAMVAWMSRLFNYLDRFYVSRSAQPPLKQVAFTCFYNAVHQDINIKAKDVVISLIEQEREGAQIDMVLLRNFFDYCVEVGEISFYEQQFQGALLDSTASYYRAKALSWISDNSGDQYYIEKAKDCLTWEKENISSYLVSKSWGKDKLLDTVRQQLLSVYENQHQLEKAKVEDLSEILSSFMI